MLAPKVQGTWNVHRALKDTKLDFFLLFSSLTGLVGRPGQANYAAANSFLDAFVKYRRNKGLAASVLDIGIMEDAGYVYESSSALLQHAENWSIQTIEEKDLFRSIEVAICSDTLAAPSQLSIGLGNTKPVSDSSVAPIWLKEARFDFWTNVLSESEFAGSKTSGKLKDLISAIAKDPKVLDRSETEQKITDEIGSMIATQMGCPEDMTGEDRAKIAVDSLMTIEIRNWFRRHIGVDISLIDISNSETVAGLGKTTMRVLRTKYTTASQEVFDVVPSAQDVADKSMLFLEDTTLAIDIRPRSDPVLEWFTEAEGNIFLTGATGFLGSFFLASLIDSPQVKNIFCLVRAKDAASGMARIEESWREYGIRSDLRRKVTVIPGDLTDAKLGMSTEDFEKFAQSSSVIFHLGARVNYIASYEEHRGANIFGLVNVLNFANHKRLKPIHYCSTFSAWGLSTIGAGNDVPEDERPSLDTDGMEQHVGYTKSKAVGEQIIWNAISNGFPISIYRPSIITGHSVTGAQVKGDLFNQLMSNCIRLGCYPDCPKQRLPIVPVDFVCFAMLHISLSNRHLGHAFNISQPDQEQTITLNEAFEILGELCQMTLPRVSLDEWLERGARSRGQAVSKAISALRERLDIGRVYWGRKTGTIPKLETRNLRKALAGHAELDKCRPFSDCFEAYYEHWAKGS